LTDEQGAFLNPSTGEIVVLTNDELYVVEREEDASNFPALAPERIERARAVIQSDDFLFLPTTFDFNERRTMEAFCASLPDESLRRQLLDAMAGEEPGQRFPDVIRSHGLEDRWRQFRAKAIEALAASWLEKNGLAFTRDEAGA
jgi:hypothetical protein